MDHYGGYQDRAKDERHLVWELDGGGYHKNDTAILFEGRLYTDMTSLRVAQVKAQARAFVNRPHFEGLQFGVMAGFVAAIATFFLQARP